MPGTPMTDTAEPMFRCEVCGRRHRWTPELAGTTITCQCLEPVAVPGQPEGDLYDLAPVPVEPIRAARPVDGYDESSPVLGYQRPIEPEVDERYSEANPLVVSVSKDLVAPIILIVLGTIAQFAAGLHFGGSPGRAAAMVGFDFVMDVGVMLVGIVMAANMLSVSFGSTPTAILKLGAIALAPGGVTSLILWGLGFGTAPHVFAWVVSLGFAVSLFWSLFDLDPSEVWTTVVIVYGIRMAAWAIWSVIFS